MKAACLQTLLRAVLGSAGDCSCYRGNQGTQVTEGGQEAHVRIRQDQEQLRPAQCPLVVGPPKLCPRVRRLCEDKTSLPSQRNPANSPFSQMVSTGGSCREAAESLCVLLPEDFTNRELLSLWHIEWLNK